MNSHIAFATSTGSPLEGKCWGAISGKLLFSRIPKDWEPQGIDTSSQMKSIAVTPT